MLHAGYNPGFGSLATPESKTNSPLNKLLSCFFSFYFLLLFFVCRHNTRPIKTSNFPKMDIVTRKNSHLSDMIPWQWLWVEYECRIWDFLGIKAVPETRFGQKSSSDGNYESLWNAAASISGHAAAWLKQPRRTSSHYFVRLFCKLSHKYGDQGKAPSTFLKCYLICLSCALYLLAFAPHWVLHVRNQNKETFL